MGFVETPEGAVADTRKPMAGLVVRRGMVTPNGTPA
jgi:hypothetical protein